MTISDLVETGQYYICTILHSTHHTCNYLSPHSDPTTNLQLTKTSSNQPHFHSIGIWLLIPLHTWAKPLWHNVCLLAHTDTLHHMLANTTRIIIVSNAAVQNNGNETCAWTIWVNYDLWTGEDYVPGPSNNMYSGLAEAYGIYTALSFLLQYSCCYPLTFRSPWTINVYCDNKCITDT